MPVQDGPSPTGAPVRVLMVDDEPALTELLSMALRYESWEVHTAADGPTASWSPGSPRLLHRAGRIGGSEEPPLVVGDLILDEAGRLVRRDGQIIELTPTEFELLRVLVRNAGRVLSRAEILDAVWQHAFGGNTDVVELFVSYLRRKVDGGRPAMIHAVPGAGYVLRAG